jgi:cobaltochelatase CobS
MKDEKIICKICGAAVHSIELHLSRDHPEVSLKEYVQKFPEAPLLSEIAAQKLKERREAEKAMKTEEPAAPAAPPPVTLTGTRAMHELFKLDARTPGALNAKGGPIPVCVLPPHDFESMVPEADEGYVWEVENLKSMMMAIELNIPLYVWGHAGTGKTSSVEQIASHTNRPMIRVQHTINTEEAHIVGQWVVKGGDTVFEYGPLALAMLNGWLYLADEYDFAMPSVLSVYQPILEGKSLIIKEADAARRMIKPHPNFRFVATGNTNGGGDESGLYQGTSIQNAANYERFGTTIQVRYMAPNMEAKVVANKAGVALEDAKKLVEFAGRVREAFEGGKIGLPISPRSLIFAALQGIRRGNYRIGINFAYCNRLDRVDREAVDQIAQRFFG